MKVSRKMKIITVIIIGIVGVVAISCANLNDKSKEVVGVTNQSILQWKSKSPQLFNNVGYSELIESNIKLNKYNVLESQVELMGVITNPLGIRDDILKYILKNATNNNQLVLKAVVKYAQNEQLIYYGNISESKAIYLANKQVLLETCLLMYNGNYNLVDNINELMRNTKKRDERMWEIDTKYFAWKVIGSGLSINDEKIACKNGEF
jgi:hypothetical protein